MDDAWCKPVYWVDGFSIDGADLSIVRPHQVRAIEIYQDPGLAPPQFRRPEVQCGVVLIWTKPPMPGVRND
jgi:hypothetical protein